MDNPRACSNTAPKTDHFVHIFPFHFEETFFIIKNIALKNTIKEMGCAETMDMRFLKVVSEQVSRNFHIPEPSRLIKYLSARICEPSYAPNEIYIVSQVFKCYRHHP